MLFQMYFELEIQILNLSGIPFGILGYRGNRESRAPSRNFYIREPKSWLHITRDVIFQEDQKWDWSTAPGEVHSSEKFTVVFF
jgi:hypothetical protein